MSGSMTPGDPLGGGGAERPPGGSTPARDRDERHESGLPMPSSSPPAGYTSPPPPGAGGFAPSAPAATGNLQLAGWWRRVGAALIDGLIIGIPAAIILAAFGVGFADTESDAGIGALIIGSILSILVIAVIGLIYAPTMMAKTNGQTLGRMATGIRVIRTNGQAMTFGWAMLREVAVKTLLINGIAGSLTFGLASLLNVLWPLWDEENRALHDYIVQTRTVLA